MTRDHSVREEFLVGQAEVLRPVGDKHVILFKAALVKQKCNAFSCRQFTLGVLVVNSFFTTTLACFLPVIKELFDSFLTVHLAFLFFVFAILVLA